MKTKTVIMLALAALALAVLAGCAQDSTNTSDDNPEMQEQVMKEKSGATGQTMSPTRKSSEKASGGTKGTKVSLSADPGGALKYNTDKLNANAGELTIAFSNESAVPHDVSVKGGGKSLGTSEQITKGSTKLVIKDIEPGTYTFFCTVPGHAQAGMTGTLTVR